MPIKVKVGNTWKDSKMGDKVSSDKLSGEAYGASGYSHESKSKGCTDSNFSYSCIGNLNAQCGSCTSYCSGGCGTSCNVHCNNSCKSYACPN